MDNEPRWTKCLHLSAGTCPQLSLEAQGLSASPSPRPELSQDLALMRLAEACATCVLAPEGDVQR